MKKDKNVNFLNSGAGKFSEWDSDLPDEINQIYYRKNQRKNLVEGVGKLLQDKMKTDKIIDNEHMTMREAFRDTIAEEMRKDKKVYILGEEVAEYQGAYKVTQGLLEEFGEKRVIDTPISEQGFTGLAVGAAF